MKKWSKYDIRPMPDNLTASKDGLWEVYSYEVNEENPHKEPSEDEISSIGKSFTYLNAVKIRDKNSKIKI